MPEGPEVTIITRSLNKLAVGKTLTAFEILSGRYTKTPIQNIDLILNQEILSVKNKGKFICWNFANQNHLFCTLGMSGGYSTSKITHSRVKLELDKWLDVWYNDVRNFGTLKIANQLELLKKLKEIGPDMINDPCSFEKFKEIIKKYPNAILGPFLLDQKKLSGIGNIYKSEICYLAALNPSRNLCSLSEDNIVDLYNAILDILSKALTMGGSSQQDYKDVDGTEGDFLKVYAQVYRRKTDRQGNPVESVSLGDGRTTWYCPSIQR